MEGLHSKHGVIANQMLLYCEYLGASYIPIYQLSGERNWMIRAISASLLGTVK